MTTTTELLEMIEHTPERTALVTAEHGFEVRRIGRVDRLLARVRSQSLDAELAAGAAPEGRWLRAVRASLLCAPGYQVGLAQAWADVLARASGARRRPLPAIAVRGAQTTESRELIAQLIDVLEGSASASVQGIAQARLLLTDGTGPLYSARSGEHLAAAVAATLAALQPSARYPAVAVRAPE